MDSIGGTSGKKINTAFREKNIHVACLFEALGEMSPKALKEIGCEAYGILRLNAFGWFRRVRKGVYDLSDDGWRFLDENQSQALVIYYRMKSLNH